MASLIDEMTAEAQKARDAFGYGQWSMDGKTGRVPGDVWAMVERADARFGIVEDVARWKRMKANQRKGK